MSTPLLQSPRMLIAFDGEAWYARRIRLIEHDCDLDEKVYRCAEHLGGPFKKPEEALLALPTRFEEFKRLLEASSIAPRLVNKAYKLVSSKEQKARRTARNVGGLRVVVVETSPTQVLLLDSTDPDDLTSIIKTNVADLRGALAFVEECLSQPPRRKR